MRRALDPRKLEHVWRQRTLARLVSVRVFHEIAGLPRQVGVGLVLALGGAFLDRSDDRKELVVRLRGLDGLVIGILQVPVRPAQPIDQQGRRETAVRISNCLQ